MHTEKVLWQANNPEESELKGICLTIRLRAVDMKRLLEAFPLHDPRPLVAALVLASNTLHITICSVNLFPKQGIVSIYAISTKHGSNLNHEDISRLTLGYMRTVFAKHC